MHRQAVADTPPATAEADVLDAMALLTCETGLVVHVVSPRVATTFARARAIAERGGLHVETDALPNTLRVRFSR
jgi:hypothetical protein